MIQLDRINNYIFLLEKLVYSTETNKSVTRYSRKFDHHSNQNQYIYGAYQMRMPLSYDKNKNIN